MRDAFQRLFNWKRHPASVFFFALPLAGLSFAALFARAVFELRQNGDPWYLVIVTAGGALLVFGLWPIRHRLLEQLRS